MPRQYFKELKCRIDLESAEIQESFDRTALSNSDEITMKQYDVWLLSTSKGCHLQVFGIGNTRCLLSRLSHEFALRGAEEIRPTDDASVFCFDLTYVQPMTQSTLESLLKSIPSIRLKIGSPVINGCEEI